jgi:hypothetical protein
MRRQQIAGWASLIASMAMGAGAPAQTTDPPLLAAFKAFCVATGARPDAVKQAVEAVGGTVFNPTGIYREKSPPLEMTLTVWNWAVGSYAMKISAGSLHDLSAPDGSRDLESCAIRGEGKDDASVEAIREWVGVAPDPKRSSPPMFIFNFEERAGVRSPLPASDAAYRVANTEGRLWSLHLFGSDQLAGAELQHFLAARTQNGPNRPQAARP